MSECQPIPKPGLAKRNKKAARDRIELRASKAEVLLRSRGRCEAGDFPHDCEGLATQFHHLRRRSQGGSNDPENLVHLCTPAHMRVHAFPAEAAAHGLLHTGGSV